MKINFIVDSKLLETIIDVRAKEMNYEVRTILSTLSNSSRVITGVRNNETFLLNFNDICVLYSENKYVYAKTDKIFKLKYRLYQLEEILNQSEFVRISNSTIINLNYVKNFETSINGLINVNLLDGTKEYVSRRYIKKIKKIMDFWGDFMVKEFFKRGFIGLISGLCILSLSIITIILLNENNVIVIEFNKNNILELIGLFILIKFFIFASSIIFEYEQINLIIKSLLHFIISSFLFIKFMQFTNINGKTHLIQAIIIALFFIIYILIYIYYIYTNEKYINELNEKINNKFK